MRNLLTAMSAACALLASAAVSAADAGLAVSLQSRESSIFVPIELGDAVRLEPFASYFWGKFGGSTQSGLQAGLGLFGKAGLSGSFGAYYGARGGYSRSRDSFGTYNGYFVEPLLGLEYWVVPQVSVSAEAGVYYQRLNGPFDQQSTGSDTRLVLRLYPTRIVAAGK